MAEIKEYEENSLENLISKYSINDDNTFNEYESKAKMVLTATAKPSEEKTLIIVGGQSGSGKDRLIPIARESLGYNAVVVDFDELRSLHPSYKEVSKLYPELTHKILHHDTNEVKDRLLKYLTEKGYNVIYEGALRNTQGFIDLAQDFKRNGYKINMSIMAVSKLSSLNSIYLRYAQTLLNRNIPRWVEKSAHDESYIGVLKTVKTFQNENLADEMRVFVRNDEKPEEIYTTVGHKLNGTILAIEMGRKYDRKIAVNDFPIRYKIVKAILESEQPEMVKKLDEWKKLYSSELEYFGLKEDDKLLIDDLER